MFKLGLMLVAFVAVLGSLATARIAVGDGDADGGVIVTRATDGERCPAVADDFVTVEGRCVATVEPAGPMISLRIRTAFGVMDFVDCDIVYPLHVDGSGRTWTNATTITGPSPCNDVRECLDRTPIEGQIESDGNGGFLHRFDMCLDSCAGRFEGEFVQRLVRVGDGWRAKPVSPAVGDQGLLMFGEWKLSRFSGASGFDLEEG